MDKTPLTEQDLVDRAARRAGRRFWAKVIILVVIAVLLLAYLFRNSPVLPDCETDPKACEQRQ
jgi:hypothetical protein